MHLCANNVAHECVRELGVSLVENVGVDGVHMNHGPVLDKSMQMFTYIFRVCVLACSVLCVNFYNVCRYMYVFGNV